MRTRRTILIVLFCIEFLLLYGQFNNSCSSISLSNGDTVIFGRNHDAVLSNCLIVFNPRYIYKEGFEFEGEIIPKWTAKYSSITFNVLGVGFAVCGMNEAGFAIGHMGFSEAKYPPKDQRPVIDQIQFITYLLDNCSSTNQAVTAAKEIRISDESTTREHYFLCDKEGNMAILEHLDGKLIIYTNESMSFPILSNDSYEQSLTYLKDYQGFGGDSKIPERNFGVREIIAIGCTKIKSFKTLGVKDIVGSSFEILNEIGFNKYPPPDTVDIAKSYGTQFTTVFDLKNRIIYFKTKTYPEIKRINFDQFKANCPEPIMLMIADTDKKGAVNDYFGIYSPERNFQFVNERLQNSGLPNEVIEFLAKYPDTFKCK